MEIRYGGGQIDEGVVDNYFELGGIHYARV